MAVNLASCVNDEPRSAFLGASDPVFRELLIKELDARDYKYQIEEDGSISYPTKDRENFQKIVKEVVKKNYVENSLKKL